MTANTQAKPEKGWAEKACVSLLSSINYASRAKGEMLLGAAWGECKEIIRLLDLYTDLGSHVVSMITRHIREHDGVLED